MARLPQTKYAERLRDRVPNASLSATASEKLGCVVPAGQSYRIDAVTYTNPTGLAASASNFFVIALKGAISGVVYASWSTCTTGAGGNGALVANTPTALVLNSTDANLVAAAGEQLQAIYTLTGTQTLPAGVLVIEGRIV